LSRRLLAALRRWRVRPPWRALFERDDGQIVSLDCETSSLEVAKAELLSVAAVKIDGRRIAASAAFHVLVRPESAPDNDNVRIHGLRPKELRAGMPPEDALRALLGFIEGRTLLGYYLEYDAAILNKYLKPMIGVPLPNRQIEISSRYHAWRQRLHPGAYTDLRWDAMIHRLGIPALPRHDALNDAITTAMMYLSLAERARRSAFQYK
jgi:DNA polymerase-3 subunit epsilon